MSNCKRCGNPLIVQVDGAICSKCGAKHIEDQLGNSYVLDPRENYAVPKQVSEGNVHTYRIRMLNGQIHKSEASASMEEFVSGIHGKKFLHLVKDNKVISVDNIECIWED